MITIDTLRAHGIEPIAPRDNPYEDADARFLDALRNGGYNERVNDAIERLIADINLSMAWPAPGGQWIEQASLDGGHRRHG